MIDGFQAHSPISMERNLFVLKNFLKHAANRKLTVLIMFGSPSVYPPLNKQPQKGKFDARSTECIFIGYSDENRVDRLFDSQANKVITSRDVKFINEFENTSNYEELFFSGNHTERKRTPTAKG
ncbi:hypothetical protein AVEN_233933-1 [Araneus ventricosus]|uniref:Retroviral polymerase SH3-like domain-containing protein n=1 Tax=Araneus ventricosus TaxID=182803 RepID=A0A4Y2JEP2_ARAVE|nr:hypothetical protein AVEN_233933-1 [Araneus ventricosus]